MKSKIFRLFAVALLASPLAANSFSYLSGFEGISQYDVAGLGRNFVPPNTMGAAGLTQYVATTNGGYAVFDKATGTRLSLTSDVDFWAAAGQTGTNGDTRVMYNPSAQRWIVSAFGADTRNLQIAVSDTDNALGSWQSVQFEGYAGLGFGGIADYPTLALDTNAVYIGTNDFAPATAGGANEFRGTTLNVIPLDSLFNAVAPTTTNMTQFVTPFPNDRGFALQGVNNSTPGAAGMVLAASLNAFDNMAYTVNGLTSASATGANLGAADLLGMAAFTSPKAARQPAVDVAANRRVVDTLDDRISSSVYAYNGHIYMVQTVDSVADGVDETRVRYTVINATTFDIVDEGDIGAAGFDYYQGSIAVNAFGEVVIAYNRSGLQQADLNGDGLPDGNISFMARGFQVGANGELIPRSGEVLLKVSLTDDYHNGSLYGQSAVGRQRWGYYSQVSIDPSNPHLFWAVGQFAREYNLPQFGHPNGTGSSRWGTWIASLDFEVNSVPEPGTLALLGLGLTGLALSRKRKPA